MNRKKYFVTIILNTVLLAFAALLCRQVLCEAQESDKINGPKATALAGPVGKFGPTMEVDLPAGKPGSPELLDLETGRLLPQERSEYFNYRVDAISAWIRSNSVDISCIVWSTDAACVTYDMIIVAAEGKCWEDTTEEELLANPALAPKGHSPRKLLILGNNRPDTYLFRTAEGNLGVLRIDGLSENGRGVKIRYKLISAAKSLSVALPRFVWGSIKESA
jgi:hypothetical protein